MHKAGGEDHPPRCCPYNEEEALPAPAQGCREQRQADSHAATSTACVLSVYSICTKGVCTAGIKLTELSTSSNATSQTDLLTARIAKIAPMRSPSRLLVAAASVEQSST